MNYQLWCYSDPDATHGYPPIFITRSSDLKGAEASALVRQEFPGIPLISDNGKASSYGYYTSSSVSGCWSEARDAEKEWDKLCELAGVPASYDFHEVMAKIPFFQATQEEEGAVHAPSMSPELYRQLQPGDLVCFGDKKNGVISQWLVNAWCQVSGRSQGHLWRIRSLTNDNFTTSDYQLKHLLPFFIREGVKHE